MADCLLEATSKGRFVLSFVQAEPAFEVLHSQLWAHNRDVAIYLCFAREMPSTGLASLPPKEKLKKKVDHLSFCKRQALLLFPWKAAYRGEWGKEGQRKEQELLIWSDDRLICWESCWFPKGHLELTNTRCSPGIRPMSGSIFSGDLTD